MPETAPSSKPSIGPPKFSTTGIGEFSEVVLNDDQVKDFQKYLIYNHSAGIGEPMPIEHVRGAIAGRINVHAH
ncbi:MAG: aromatic amino acid lyase, partial [Clostridiales bacterium]|nr:aromatic amino acid lyase [Clostridiales bacterium]